MSEDVDEIPVEHIFEHAWNNLAVMFRANCSCGEDYGFCALLGELGTSHDEHLEEVFES